MVDTERGQLSEVAEQVGQPRLAIFAQLKGGRNGFLNLRLVAARRVAMVAKHPQLVLEIVMEAVVAHVEQVAGVGVPSHQA